MRVQKFRLELYQHGLWLSCICGFPISLTLHVEALCLLLGLKWQPPSGKACPLNRIYENWLPHATEILGYDNGCRWINHSCFHPDCILPFPIREIPPGFPSYFRYLNYSFVHLESRNSCSCSGPYHTQGGKQSPEVSHSSQDWQFYPPCLGELWSVRLGHCGPAAFGIHLKGLSWQPSSTWENSNTLPMCVCRWL